MKNRLLQLLSILLMGTTIVLPLAGCVSIKDSHYSDVSTTLINENSSPNTVKLYNYLLESYGKYTFSGQYINEYEDFAQPEYLDAEGNRTVFMANELQVVKQVTGKSPAILGLDLSQIELGEHSNITCYSIEQAREWHDAGGIVTMCWHWCAPSSSTPISDRHFYTDNTDFNLTNALADKTSAEYQGLIADIDSISVALAELNELDIPILWRPLHEASGGWFWWGAFGKEAYLELWDIIYERMTVHHGLNNLIWVSNSQNKSWYVGDDKCDMISDDVYSEVHPDDKAEKMRPAYLKDSGLSRRFKHIYKTTSTKMIAMTENDYAPDPDAMKSSNTTWLMFANWAREFICVMDPTDKYGWATTLPEYNPTYLSASELSAIYNHERVLTLDEITKDGYYYNK